MNDREPGQPPIDNEISDAMVFDGGMSIYRFFEERDSAIITDYHSREPLAIIIELPEGMTRAEAIELQDKIESMPELKIEE